MKRNIMMALAFVAISSALYANEGANTSAAGNPIIKHNRHRPPHIHTQKPVGAVLDPGSNLTAALQRDFHVTDAKWTRGAYYAEAHFVQDAQPVTAFYTYENELVGSTTVKLVADLPAKTHAHLQAKYPDWQVERIVQFSDNEANDNLFTLYDMPMQDNVLIMILYKDGQRQVYNVDEQGDMHFVQTI